MPINPGPRHPIPTKKDKVAIFVGRNTALVAYSAGLGVGVFLTLVVASVIGQ